MNGVELNRLGMQHRILRSLSLRLPSLQAPLAVLVQEALVDELKGKTFVNGMVKTRAALEADHSPANN